MGVDEVGEGGNGAGGEEADGADGVGTNDAGEGGANEAEEGGLDEAEERGANDAGGDGGADDVAAGTAEGVAVTGDDDAELDAVMNLLAEHDDRWHKSDASDARYEVELPDGTTEHARAKDDVRGLLFRHYR